MDEAAMWGFIGTAIGAAASIATSWIASKTASSVESEKLRQERLEAAREFQRATALELQEVIHDCARFAARAHHEDFLAHRRDGGPWGRNMLSEEVNEGQRLAIRKVHMLAERLASDALRDRVKSFTRLPGLASIGRASNGVDSEERIHQVALEAMQVVEALGVELRRQYPELLALGK